VTILLGRVMCTQQGQLSRKARREITRPILALATEVRYFVLLL